MVHNRGIHIHLALSLVLLQDNDPHSDTLSSYTLQNRLHHISLLLQEHSHNRPLDQPVSLKQLKHMYWAYNHNYSHLTDNNSCMNYHHNIPIYLVAPSYLHNILPHKLNKTHYTPNHLYTDKNNPSDSHNYHTPSLLPLLYILMYKPSVQTNMGRK